MQKYSLFGVPGRPKGIELPSCACANRSVGGVDKRQIDPRLGIEDIHHVEAPMRLGGASRVHLQIKFVLGSLVSVNFLTNMAMLVVVFHSH